MMLAVLGLSGHAGVITQHISMPEESPTLTIAEEDGEEFTVVNWADLEHEAELGRFKVPINTFTLQVPTYSKDFTVSASNISWRNPISLDFPLETVSVECTSVPMEFTKEPILQTDNTRNTTALSVEIINEYFLNWTEHYVMVKIDCVVPIDSMNIIPLQSADIHIEFRDCKPNEIDFDIPIVREDIEEQNGLTKAISLGIGSPLDKYIIITTEELYEGCRNLALWKTQKGLAVQTYTIEHILSGRNYQIGTNGIVDEADALRRFLQTVCDPSVDNYCLFIGPSEKIPLRYFYYKEPARREHPNDNKIGYDNFIPADMYYSDLGSVWQLENDPAGIYAIPNSSVRYSPSIYVGRLVCNKKQDIDNYLHKLIYYEADPGKGDNNYLGRGLATRQRRIASGLNLLTKLGTLNEVIQLFDNGGADFTTSTPQGCDVLQAMKQVGLFTIQGHGTPGSIACAGAGGETNIHKWRYIKVQEEYRASEIGYGNYGCQEEPNSGLDLLDNIYKPSVFYSMACDIMPFDEFGTYSLPYNLGTMFTIADLYGGVAVVGNTRSGYINRSDILERQFASEILAESHIGKALAFAKANVSFYDEYGDYTRVSHNLMGDPEFCMWKHKPNVQDVKLTLTDIFLQASGPTLPNSNIILFDGVNPPTKLLPTETSYSANLTRMNIENNIFSTAIWKDGMLPYISIIAQKAELKNSSRSFIVHDASFGAVVNPAKSTGECVVGQNANLNVTALKSLNITDGFRVTANGQANFRCVEDISISGGVVESASRVNLNGGDVVISGNFCVTEGTELQINHNPEITNPFAYGTN